MPMIQCPSCAVTLKVPETAIGKNVKCRCGTVIAVPSASQPKAKSAPATPSVPTASYLDQLTAKDFQRTEKPVEQPTESQNKKNSDALAPFIKAEAKSGKRSVSERERWDNIDAIYTIFFALAILNVAGTVVSIIRYPTATFYGGLPLFLLLSIIPPSILGGTGFGLMLRKTWGWWMAILSLGMVAGALFPWMRGFFWLINAIIRGAIEFSVAFEAIGNGAFACLIAGIAIWMLTQLISYPVMKKFKVTMPLILAWVISIFGGYTAGLIYSYVMFRIIFNIVF